MMDVQFQRYNGEITIHSSIQMVRNSSQQIFIDIREIGNIDDEELEADSEPSVNAYGMTAQDMKEMLANQGAELKTEQIYSDGIYIWYAMIIIKSNSVNTKRMETRYNEKR
jgi:hypothetical protein